MTKKKSSAKSRRLHYLQLVGPDYQPCDEPRSGVDAPSAFDAFTDIETRLRFAVGTLVALSGDESVESFVADALCGVETHLRQAQCSLERLHELQRDAEAQA